MKYSVKEVSELTGNYVQHIRYLIKSNAVPFHREKGSCHCYLDEAGLEFLKNYKKRGYKKK